MISFAYPVLGWLIFLPRILYYILPRAGKMYGDALRIPFVSEILAIKAHLKGRTQFTTNKGGVSRTRKLLLMIVWVLCVVALCRPQWVGEPQKVHQETRDIMLVVDISKSMLERDFTLQNYRYDRLTAVKNVVAHFVDERPDDRIGLVVFGTRAYMQVPLTFDKESLKETLFYLDAGMAGNSTSIGDAIGVALKNMAMDDGAPENKVIILLTDGENNDGSLSFPQALKLASEEKVKFYTIGVGNDRADFFGGLFSMPVDSGLDEESLKQLSAVTKGSYFRAKDMDSLIKIYDEINRLEAEDQEGRFIQETKDLYYWPAALAVLLFLLLCGLAGRK